MQISFPFEQFPLPGTVREIAEGVLWVRMPLPFALDHVNLWLIRDGSCWTLVDTGIALDDVKNCWRQLLPAYSLSRLIATHCHPDHLGLAGWLAHETGAPLWITQGEYLTAQMLYEQIGSYSRSALLALFHRHGLDESRTQAMARRGNSYKGNSSEVPATYTRLFGGQQLVIGGRDWRVICGYGHSPEHAALYCAELNLLISGDMLLPRITTNVSVIPASPDGNPLALFLASIDDFKPLPDDTLVLPSHGKPFRGLHQRVAELVRHHGERLSALLAAAGQPKTAAELMPVLFERTLDDPHQVLFAMGETIAHLNFLEHRQQLQRINTKDITRFVKPQK
ncbi:MAG: MBL fold metallo-hydrolase [Sterolibacterium sp.]|nr:MBL fold metallo-hydrolase [Sterolibacterium sp.]